MLRLNSLGVTEIEDSRSAVVWAGCGSTVNGLEQPAAQASLLIAALVLAAMRHAVGECVGYAIGWLGDAERGIFRHEVFKWRFATGGPV